MQFQFPGQTNFYKGKVRDVYTINDRWLVMIASNRISAFDVILPEPIPYKGQILNQIAAFMLTKCSDICPVWLIDVPAPQASIGLKCVPFSIELVVRGYLCGHAWREYKSGKRVLCGVSLPEGLKENDPLPTPIITPTTKAHQGHDMDISVTEILASGLATSGQWENLESFSLALFKRGSELAAGQGLILADTKYEFGLIGNTIYLMDEIHTPDSSRYFHLDGFEERQRKDEKQLQLSKEFVREWLISKGFTGQEGQQVPEMTQDWIRQISERYIELYEKLTGLTFKPETLNDVETEKRILTALENLT